MQYEEKLKRLKSLQVLRQVPERQVAALAEFVRPRSLEDGEVLFREGSIGMSLYFISSGRIRVRKGDLGGAGQDLAVLAAGEFFGEMALAEETPRSASAVAQGQCVLFELFRGDLARWAKSNPQQAVQFFVELLLLESRRLRRTSNELNLHFELSSRLFDRGKAAPDLLADALDRVLPRLDGSWSAAAYLRAEPGGEMKLAVSRGPAASGAPEGGALPEGAGASGWLDAATFHVALEGQKGGIGRLLFRSGSPLGAEQQDEAARMLVTMARLVASALDIRG